MSNAATKRKQQSGQAGPSSSSSSPTKRVRIDAAFIEKYSKSSDATDLIEGDPELEDQDRKRNQQGRKGRIITQGYESESSDEEDQDGGTHRRKADKSANQQEDDDEDEDIFDIKEDKQDDTAKGNGKKTEPKFLKLSEIEGQEFASKRRIGGVDAEDDDEEANQDDEIDPELELEDSDNDDDEQQDELAGLNAESEITPPTSPGGTPLATDGKEKAKQVKKKKKGPRVTGFNMKEEMRTGKFDQDGNFIENAKDPHAQHDAWLAGVYSKKKIKAARKAQLKREQELREKERVAEEQDKDEDNVTKTLVEHMMKGETVQKTLQRLGKQAQKHRTNLAEKKRYQHKNQSKPDQDLDQEMTNETDIPSTATETSPSSGETAVKPSPVEQLESVTHLSSVLMSRFGHIDIYQQTYETLLKQVKRSGLVRDNFDPAARFEQHSTTTVTTEPDRLLQAQAQASTGTGTGTVPTDALSPSKQWEYKWSPSYLAASAKAAATSVAPEVEIFGPYSAADLTSWSQGGYFGVQGERILLREAGSKEAWKSLTDCLVDGSSSDRSTL